MGETICVTPPVCKFSPYLQPITVSLSVTSSIINNLAFILTRVRKRPAVHGVRTARWGCYLAIRTRWPTGSAICVQFLILFYFFYPLTQKKKANFWGSSKTCKWTWKVEIIMALVQWVGVGVGAGGRNDSSRWWNNREMFPTWKEIIYRLRSTSYPEKRWAPNLYFFTIIMSRKKKNVSPQ